MNDVGHDTAQPQSAERKFCFDLTRGSDDFVPQGNRRLEERTLGLGTASAGLVTARLIRSRGSGENGSSTVRTDSHQVMDVLRGTVHIEDESGTKQQLRGGSVAYFPPDFEYRQRDWSFDFEALLLGARAAGAPSDGARRAIYDHEHAGSYATAGPGRDYLSLRPLKLADRTQRQFEVMLIKGLKSPSGGTGWHTNTNSEWVLVLSGAAEVALSGHENFTIRAGDSMTFPPDSVHAVPGFSVDYALVAVNAPADFKTEPVQPPH